MVLVVASEVIGKPAYSRCEEGHLNFGGASVTRLSLVFLNDLLFGRGI